MAKVALLIGTSEYEAGLAALPGALEDVAALKSVLAQPEIGDFAEVRELPNPDPQEMQEAIELIFSGCTKEELGSVLKPLGCCLD
jgi:Caspase domain